MSTISIKGVDKAAILAALYNASRPQGMGFLHYDPEPMSADVARKLLQHSTEFDYLKGRVMKVDLGGDELNTWGYDRDNGDGAALRAIGELLRTGNVNPAGVRAAHHEGKLSAAINVRDNIGTKTRLTDEGIHLGFDDVSDVLAPAVNRAVRMG